MASKALQEKCEGYGSLHKEVGGKSGLMASTVNEPVIHTFVTNQVIQKENTYVTRKYY